MAQFAKVSRTGSQQLEKIHNIFSEAGLLIQIFCLAIAAADPNLAELAKPAAPAEHRQPLVLQLAKWLESFFKEGHFLQFLKPFSKQYGENPAVVGTFGMGLSKHFLLGNCPCSGLPCWPPAVVRGLGATSQPCPVNQVF